MSEVITVIFRAPRAKVDEYASKHLEGYRSKSFDRGKSPMTAIQAPIFEKLGREGVMEVAAAHSLPVVDLVTSIPRWP